MKLTPRQRQVERVEKELAYESAFRAGDLECDVQDPEMAAAGEVTQGRAGELARDLPGFMVAPATGPVREVPVATGMAPPPPNPGGLGSGNSRGLTAQQQRIAEDAIERFVIRVQAWSQGCLDQMTPDTIEKARDQAIADIGGRFP